MAAATCGGECPDQTLCLRLVAHAGRPTRSPEDWSRLDGDFRRRPLNIRKVGRIGVTWEGILIKEVAGQIRQEGLDLPRREDEGKAGSSCA